MYTDTKTMEVNRIVADINKTVCFSGPRPTKYDYGKTMLEQINSVLRLELTGLINSGCNRIIFGAAPGFDLIGAKLALQLKQEFTDKEIQIICALPYLKFSASSYFDNYWRSVYNAIVPQCEIISVNNANRYYMGCFKARNFYMVDNSSTLICLYDGNPGGTGQTHSYAAYKRRRIINIYERVNKI